MGSRVSFQRRASAFDLARRAGARYVGVNSADSAGLEEYMASGTYTPTVTTESATVAPYLLSGYSRVGNGAGVPLAGDTVTVTVFIDVAGLTDGEVVIVTLPFVATITTTPYVAPPVIISSTSDLTARSAFASTTAMSVTFTVETDDSGLVSLFAIYQTANAIDP